MSAVCLLRGGSSVPHPVAFGDGLRSCCGCVCEVHFLPSMRTAGPACLFGLMVSRPSHQLFGLASLLGDCAHGLPRTTPVCRAQSLVWITLPLASCFVHRLSPFGVWKRANMLCFCVQGCVGRARRRQRAQRLTSLDHLRRRRTCHMWAFACSRASGCWPPRRGLQRRRRHRGRGKLLRQKEQVDGRRAVSHGLCKTVMGGQPLKGVALYA